MDEELSARFHAAVCADNAGEVAAIISDHPELIGQPLFDFDQPAIVFSAGRRQSKTLEVLLDAGADINARSKWWAGGFGVLDCCPPEAANYLIGRGATVDAHAAARLGRIDRLRALVEADPGLVHARGGDGKTPLHFAATAEIAEYLLARGADIDALDIDHESTPAMHLVGEHPEVARYLVSRGCRTDILLAAAVGGLSLVSAILDRDPESIRTRVDGTYFPKRNPHSGGVIYIWTLGANFSVFQVARKFGHADVLALLLSRSPMELKLSAACILGDRAAAQALLAIDRQLARKLPEAERAQVRYAAEANQTEPVLLMLECGWPVAGRPMSPLHWACWHGNVEMVRGILRFDPPLEAKDDHFQGTPLGWAIHGSENSWHRTTGDYAAVVETLLQAGSIPPKEFDGSAAVREVLRRYRVREKQ